MQTKKTSRPARATSHIRRWLCAMAISCATHAIHADDGAPPLLPEATDPVLGSRAAVVEWAWSPAYAKQFGVETQEDGLKDGPLWMIGVKVTRHQDGEAQSYRCGIVGLLDNKTPILTPPGDRYIVHPAYRWAGTVPRAKRSPYVGPAQTEQREFLAAHGAWRRNPITQAQREWPESAMKAQYLMFHRYYTPELAYFEFEAACAFFREPENRRNEIRFPTRLDTPDELKKSTAAVWAPDAVAFDIPDRVMTKMFPYTRKAADWTICLLRRAGDKFVAIHKDESARLNTSCEPVGTNSVNR